MLLRLFPAAPPKGCACAKRATNRYCSASSSYRMRMREKGEVTHESAFLYILSPLRISKPNGHSPPAPARELHPPPVGALSAPACAFCWNGLRIPATWWWARMRIGAGFRIRSGRAAGNSLSGKNMVSFFLFLSSILWPYFFLVLLKNGQIKRLILWQVFCVSWRWW